MNVSHGESRLTKNTFSRSQRWAVFISGTIGYSLYYVCRLSLSALKTPLVKEGVLTETQLGLVGAGLFYAYAIGKCVNGFVADRANLRRMLAAGLALSALINLVLGFSPGFLFFTALWIANGWVQSMGAPACIVSLARWFERKERGTYYGLWSASHNIGESLTFIAVAVVSTHYGWRWGFWGAAISGIIGSLMVMTWFHERAPVAEKEECKVSNKSVIPKLTAEQWLVIKTPMVWAIAGASSLMYVARYAVNSWGMFFLETGKGYGRVDAGTIISIGAVAGVVGTITSGWLSDRWFSNNRFLPSVLAGVINAVSLAAFLQNPAGRYWLDVIYISGFGVSIGALICYLGGLLAIDSVPADSAGASLGIVGIASYIGAAAQDFLSGVLIEHFKCTVQGTVRYDFLPVGVFWVGAAVGSVLITLGIWWVSQRNKQIESKAA